MSLRHLTQKSIFNIICFSKDRPFQLSQFLSSFAKHVNCDLDDNTSTFVNVLYTFTDGDDGKSYKNSYNHVIDLYPDVHFVKEKSREDFALQLEQMVNNDFGSTNNTNIYIIFAVDDVLFYQNMPLNLVTRVYTHTVHSQNVFSMHLKLNPNITYCHPKQAKAARPNFFTSLSQSFNSRINVALFERTEGAADWNYPFDLCCSIYRKAHVVTILKRIEKLFGKRGYSHPNLLEVNGNKVLRSVKKSKKDENSNNTSSLAVDDFNDIDFLKAFPLCACPTLPVMSVLTINRVQDIFTNAIYGVVNDALLLEKKFTNNRNLKLNLAKYKQNIFSSVHIGELYLEEEETITDSDENGPFISVVMCVYNGEKYLSQAIDSILNQTYTNFEFIIVNDGSVDDTNSILKSYSIKDKRIILIQNETNLGIARSLNVAIKHTKGQFIARMDSDDISHPERFWYQVNAFKMNPTYDIIGTGVIKIYDDDEHINNNNTTNYDENAMQKNRKIISNPINNLLINWSMFFFCSIAHPTMMLRRKVFFEIGKSTNNAVFAGYPEDCNFSCIEDYACWFEKLEILNCKVMNLGHILLGLRQHAHRVSSEKFSLQQEQTINFAHSKIAKRINDEEMPIEALKGLYFPAKINSIDILKEATKLLLALEKSVRSSHGNDAEFILVEDDVTNRLGELATIGMAKFTSDAISVWLQWMDRTKRNKKTREQLFI